MTEVVGKSTMTEVVATAACECTLTLIWVWEGLPGLEATLGDAEAARFRD